MKQLVKINEVKENPTNPRTIKDYKFAKLVKSIKEFPDMLEKRPIVVDESMIVLGGNMRLKACKEAGLKEVWIDVAEGWTEEQKKEFIIKDNVGYGEWDWDILANEYETELLEDWGMDLPLSKEEDETYTTKVESPIYEPKADKPNEEELYNLKKYNSLIEKISLSNLPEEKKEFLRLAATRHIEFNYSKIAEYYAHEEKEAQLLMEDNALVIIDYDKAIELGFVKLYSDLETLAEIDE
jgi:hypothetical protein